MLARRSPKDLLPSVGRIWLLVVILCSLGLGSCDSGPRTTLRRLSSGRSIRVISIVHMEFKNPPPALVLKYQTDLNLDEQDKLQAEVTEIWAEFQADVEKAGLQSGAIIACENPHGWPIYKFRTYGFVFDKAADGSWSQSKSK